MEASRVRTRRVDRAICDEESWRPQRDSNPCRGLRGVRGAKAPRLWKPAVSGHGEQIELSAMKRVGGPNGTRTRAAASGGVGGPRTPAYGSQPCPDTASRSSYLR